MAAILQFTGILGTFLLFCGILKFYIYYKRFGINILRFIELDEILTLFMDNIIAYIAIILPTSIYLFLINSPISIKWAQLVQYFSFLNQNLVLVISFIVIGIIGAIIFKIKNPGVNIRDLAYIALLVIACAILAPVFYRFLLNIEQEPESKIQFSSGVFLIIVCTLLLGYSILTALNEARKVIKNGYYTGTKLFFKAPIESIDSNHNVFFVGMTKSYVFIYKKSTKTCMAIKSDNLEKIEFIKPKG